MPVTERLMGPGSWSVKLNEHTPRHVRDILDYFGHIVICPGHVDPSAIGDAATLDAARYTGIVRRKPSTTELGGVGLVAWLGDEDGKGAVLESRVEYAAGSFATWVGAIRPSSLAAGTVTDPGGTLTWSTQFMSRRAALDYVCDYFGAEYRIRPDGTLDAGPASALFATATPTAIVTAFSGGIDMNITGLHATALGRSEDVEDYTTRVVLLGTGNGRENVLVGTADISPATGYKDLLGNAAVLTRMIDAPNVQAGNESSIATVQLGRFTSARQAVTLSSDRYDIGHDVQAGDQIYVYDSDAGLVDQANQIYYRGQLLFPVKLRVQGYTWPVERGMGVYYRDKNGVYTDLTDWVEWESPGSSIDMGASARTLTDTTAAATVQAGRTQTRGRELWVPASSFSQSLTGSTFVAAGTWPNATPGWDMPDGGAVRGVVGNVRLPSDYESGSLTMDAYFQGGGSGNFRIGIESSSRTPGTPGDTIFHASEAAGSVTIASYNGLAVAVSLLTGLTATAGDIITIAFSRDPTHAGDTSADILFFVGVVVKYLAA